jgi:glyoxylase-like metal-dependent hydrolase (beta-lactamase superfamily II)
VLVDSFDCDTPRRPAGEFLLRHFGGKLAALILTHPHKDHCDGIVELIDLDATSVLACVHPNNSDAPGTIPIDAIAYLKKSINRHTLAFGTSGPKRLSRRHDTFRKDQLDVGGARCSLRCTRQNPSPGPTGAAIKTSYRRRCSSSGMACVCS